MDGRREMGARFNETQYRHSGGYIAAVPAEIESPQARRRGACARSLPLTPSGDLCSDVRPRLVNRARLSEDEQQD